MERDNGGVSSEGVLIPVPDSSGLFQSAILAPLQSAYLYEESRHLFKYQSAVLVNNPSLEEKYNAFREKRKEEGYSEDDLKESYGFLLFNDFNKAITLGRTGVLTGNSTCTTLGDPSKGVYISMYSDCLDSNCWYHVKSGHIAIIRLTKGRVKKVVEIYTQNFTPPTEGFDCHVSEQLPSVSSETSSFLAFERTQYYMYELLKDGSNETAQSPSAACPFAIVSFLYSNSKAKLEEPQQKSEVKKTACPYLLWRGKLQLGTEFYSLGLRSMTEASMPTKLPPVVKISRAISVADLRHLLPRAVFETCIIGEAFLDGLYCSLFEFISSEKDKSKRLTLLVDEIQKNDAALIVSLNDGGFLILLHSSHFLGCDEMDCSSTERLQGIFVFPDSRIAVRDVKFEHKPPAISPDKLWFLPALRSAEDKVGGPAIDSGEQLWERLVQFMQNYKAPLSPGLELSPSREACIFPDRYDEQESLKHLDYPPKWSKGPCQRLKSYLRKPASFQLPLSEASEILAAEEEQQREDLDDDVYIRLSSPEMESPVSSVLKDQGSDETCVEPLDNFVPRAEAQSDSQPVPENVVRDALLPGCAAKDNRQCATHSELGETDDAEQQKRLIPLSDDLPSELIVSITSAEQSVTEDSICVDGNTATTKHDGFEFGGISMSAKLQILQKNSHGDKPAEVRKVLTRPEVIKPTTTKKRKRRRGRYKKQTQGPMARTPSSQRAKTPDKIDGFNNREVETTKEASGDPPRNVVAKDVKMRALRRKRGEALAEEKAADPKQGSLENSILMELKAGPLRKKTELWDLKPVVSECGRILVPHGSLDIDYHMKRIQERIRATRDDLKLDKPLPDVCETIHYTVEMEQTACTGQETSVHGLGMTKCIDGTNQQQNVTSDANLDESVLEHPGNSSETIVEPLTKNTDSPSQALREKQTDSIYSGENSQKGVVSVSKLKSVFRRGKQKIDLLSAGEATGNPAEDTVTCHKKRKVETNAEMVTGDGGRTLFESPSVDTISSMPPIDVFALALGLTPKETRVKGQTTDEQKNQQNDDSPATQERPFSDQQHQILRQPLSIYPQRRRIKTLKKLQGISEECIKKKCTPFAASPLSGATRLLLHHQTVYSDEFKTPQSFVGQGDQCEATDSPRCLKKLLTSRKTFRHARVFSHKDGFVQVTRHWPEQYNFEPDSKFASEMKSKTVVRALHGPWDFTIHDSEMELRFIFHMRIGLFYSRSTARFFHVDSNCTYPRSEEFLDIPNPVRSNPAEDNPTAGTFGDASESSIPDVLDLSKKCIAVPDEDSVILDFSLKKTIPQAVASEPPVSKKETSVLNEPDVNQTLNESKSPEEPKERQQESGQFAEQNSAVNDANVKSVAGETAVNSFCKSIIPFIGPDISADETAELQDPLLQSNGEDVVKEKEGIPFIMENCNSEATLSVTMLGTSEICVKNKEPSLPVVPLYQPSEPRLPENGGNSPDDRCPTPTIDEVLYEHIPLGSKDTDEILKNICKTSSSSSNAKLPKEKDLCRTPAVSAHLSSHSSLGADLERPTRVLQSVNGILSKSDHTDGPRENKFIDMNESPDRTSDSRDSLAHSVSVLKQSNLTKEEKPTMGSATQSSDSDPSLKDTVDQILSVKSLVKKADSSLPPSSHDELETSAWTDFSHFKASQANQSHVNQETRQPNSQCNSKHEHCSQPQQPVVALKPRKRNKSQVDCLPRVEESSQNILASAQVAECTNHTPVVLENADKKPSMENLKTLIESHGAKRFCSTASLLTNGPHKSNSETTVSTHLKPALFYQGDEKPDVNRIASSLPSISSIESARRSPNRLDEEQGYLRCARSVEDFEQRTKETTDIKQAACSDAPAQLVTHKNNGVVDDSLIQTPSTSLVCTILNAKETTSVSFLEQVARRCVQVDPTQASIEQAYLIFLEKMKQLVKKSKRRPTRQDDAFDHLRPSCPAPVTIHFSNLDEQDVSMCPLSTPLFGQTIMVDMSDRKDPRAQSTRRPQEISHAAGGPLQNAGVSHLSAECAQLYEEAMDGICTVQMDLPRPKRFKVDGGHLKTGRSNYFNFCDQMKRQMDERFRSKLNTLVKKSCKTRYRFFILLTSDDNFFEETKAQLEREGHTAVDPEKFRRNSKDSLSPLLVVLKNEDIAENIFQVPHLLELKRSPNVRFAGIDAPDDVINLTHQEVFAAGGIVVFDKAALESLSLCHMKKVSTQLQELDGTGRWKWLLHYRDSRRIKENARLNGEAGEKRSFLQWGQDVGLLEVMPYHECDLLSREQPDYLACLIRLQIQHISSRHTLFITDSATDGSYERKGIVTMTMSSFLTQSLRETFPV